MPNIRVTCPTCKAELEIDAQYAGQEVECGSCLQVFVAKDPNARDASESTGKKPYKARREQDDEDEDRPRRRRRRRDDDDDDDDDYGPPSRSGGGGGTASLVLGILALLTSCLCACFSIPLAIAAIVTGLSGMKNPQSKGTATVGLVLGLIALLLTVVGFVVGFGMNFANPGQFGRPGRFGR